MLALNCYIRIYIANDLIYWNQGGRAGAGGKFPLSFGDLFGKFWEFLKIHFSLLTAASP